jgi:hypothetical protein
VVNAVVTLMGVAVMLAGGAILGHSALAATRRLSASWDQRTELLESTFRTRGEIVCTSSTGRHVYVVLRNTGGQALLAFPFWDVLVQYTAGGRGGYHQRYLVYTSGIPRDNEWTVLGIYIDKAANVRERFQPGILDPGEEVWLHLRLSPPAATNVHNRVTVGVDNGVTAAGFFRGSDSRCDGG